jgi:carbon monoxide dehydrogenase subunit G
MEMTGEQLIPASQQDTWNALNDPEILKSCVPGCESIDLIAEHEYQVLMVARVGPVSAKFKGKLSLSDLDPPNSYTIAFEGQGGGAGFGKGGAQVSLAQEAEGTRLTYKVKASVGGKLAQIGSRLVDAAARKLSDDFFKAFNNKVASLHGGPPHDETHDESHGEHHPGPVPPDPDMPTVSNASAALIAAIALVAVAVALFVLYG